MKASVNGFDDWITEHSGVAAATMRQWLVPVEGSDAVVFPPTYAKPEGMREEDWLGYNVDVTCDGKVCLIDSVGSQANRMEPIFKEPAYRNLVPQVVVRVKTRDGDREVNLLDAGHRAADAVVRFSDLAEDFRKAFEAYRDGNAEPMARLAPTSLVFGAWDSRATQVKLPRIVRSVIRAFDTEVLHRSAQYIPPVDYEQEEAIDPQLAQQKQKRMSKEGLLHAPAAWTHGGVLVRGGIRRDAMISLTSLRKLAVDGDADRTVRLRRYVLGLALVSFTAPLDPCLRQGCELVPDPDRPAEWALVRHDGRREAVELSHEDALSFARAAAEAFGVGEDRTGAFDPKQAQKLIAMDKAQRKAARRGKSS